MMYATAARMTSQATIVPGVLLLAGGAGGVA
jgi:hypothetical protein